MSEIIFEGTPQQAEALKKCIDGHRGEKGALMPVLQEAQAIYGYLPVEVQTQIAEGLDLPLAEVFGVATFYSQFSLKPKGKHKISVCLGTACYVKGSDKAVGDFLRGMYARQKVLYRKLPLRRRVRSCSRNDC